MGHALRPPIASSEPAARATAERSRAPANDRRLPPPTPSRRPHGTAPVADLGTSIPSQHPPPTTAEPAWPTSSPRSHRGGRPRCALPNRHAAPGTQPVKDRCGIQAPAFSPPLRGAPTRLRFTPRSTRISSLDLRSPLTARFPLRPSPSQQAHQGHHQTKRRNNDMNQLTLIGRLTADPELTAPKGTDLPLPNCSRPHRHRRRRLHHHRQLRNPRRERRQVALQRPTRRSRQPAQPQHLDRRRRQEPGTLRGDRQPSQLPRRPQGQSHRRTEAGRGSLLAEIESGPGGEAGSALSCAHAETPVTNSGDDACAAARCG